MVMERSTTGVLTSSGIDGSAASPTNTRYDASSFGVILELSTDEGFALYIENHTDDQSTQVTDGVINVTLI